jgi:hypothetical protein
VEGQMGELVPERPPEITGVGPEQNGPGARQSQRRSPRGGPAADQRIQSGSVGNDDQGQAVGRAPPEAGPLGRAPGLPREGHGQIDLRRPGDGRNRPDPDGPRPGRRLLRR